MATAIEAYSVDNNRPPPGHWEGKNWSPTNFGLTLEQAIRGYTIDTAYMIGWEKIIGSLEVGKRADLIVLSQNPFEIKPAEIHKTDVLLTMLNGKVVYEQVVDWSVDKLTYGYDAFGNEY